MIPNDLKLKKIEAFVAVRSQMNIPLKEGTWTDYDSESLGKLHLLKDLSKLL